MFYHHLLLICPRKNGSGSKEAKEMSEYFHQDERAQLPALIERRRAQAVFFRYRLSSDFASQLIAERSHFPVQSARRRTGALDASRAYAQQAQIRLPAGFRMSESA